MFTLPKADSLSVGGVGQSSKMQLGQAGQRAAEARCGARIQELFCQISRF